MTVTLAQSLHTQRSVEPDKLEDMVIHSFNLFKSKLKSGAEKLGLKSYGDTLLQRGKHSDIKTLINFAETYKPEKIGIGKGILKGAARAINIFSGAALNKEQAYLALKQANTLHKDGNLTSENLTKILDNTTNMSAKYAVEEIVNEHYGISREKTSTLKDFAKSTELGALAKTAILIPTIAFGVNALLARSATSATFGAGSGGSAAYLQNKTSPGKLTEILSNYGLSTTDAATIGVAAAGLASVAYSAATHGTGYSLFNAARTALSTAAVKKSQSNKGNSQLLTNTAMLLGAGSLVLGTPSTVGGGEHLTHEQISDKIKMISDANPRVNHLHPENVNPGLKDTDVRLTYQNPEDATNSGKFYHSENELQALKLTKDNNGHLIGLETKVSGDNQFSTYFRIRVDADGQKGYEINEKVNLGDNGTVKIDLTDPKYTHLREALEKEAKSEGSTTKIELAVFREIEKEGKTSYQITASATTKTGFKSNLETILEKEPKGGGAGDCVQTYNNAQMEVDNVVETNNNESVKLGAESPKISGIINIKPDTAYLNEIASDEFLKENSLLVSGKIVDEDIQLFDNTAKCPKELLDNISKRDMQVYDSSGVLFDKLTFDKPAELTFDKPDSTHTIFTNKTITFYNGLKIIGDSQTPSFDDNILNIPHDGKGFIRMGYTDPKGSDGNQITVDKIYKFDISKDSTSTSPSPQQQGADYKPCPCDAIKDVYIKNRFSADETFNPKDYYTYDNGITTLNDGKNITISGTSYMTVNQKEGTDHIYDVVLEMEQNKGQGDFKTASFGKEEYTPLFSNEKKVNDYWERIFPEQGKTYEGQTENISGIPLEGMRIRNVNGFSKLFDTDMGYGFNTQRGFIGVENISNGDITRCIPADFDRSNYHIGLTWGETILAIAGTGEAAGIWHILPHSGGGGAIASGSNSRTIFGMP